MHVDPDNLRETLDALAKLEFDALDLEDVLGQAVDAAAGLIGVAGAGIMLADENAVMRYVAASDDTARILEVVQEEQGTGPCIDCVIENELVVSDDLASDTRWPMVAAAISEKGVLSLLGAPLSLGGAPVGSLNIYDDAPRPWDVSDSSAAETLARTLEAILDNALRTHRGDTLVAQLQYALDHRVMIERAVGFLMAAEGLDAIDAFNRLRTTARNDRTPVAQIATRLLTERTPPASGS